ncbi:MAG: IS1595 family transposase [Methylocella sp.]
MAKSDIQNPAFTDDNKAREALEGIRWPDGPYCPHCGNLDQERIAKGYGKAHRSGLYYCAACNGQFTVTIGTVMEDSKIPLSKWLLAMHLMGASKKGMSAVQLSRMLGITYKSAWFLCHRIREAMAPVSRSRIGGESKVVESDETVFGGKAKNRAYAKKESKKHAVMTLVERDGESRSFYVANVKAKTLREKIVTTVSRESHLMTDELASYEKVGKEFANHGTVNHSANEYANLGGFVHVNTAECRFSLMKRAVFGTHHSISEAHLPRYLAEWDFKWNTRGINDGERAALIAKGIEGKRLTYRPTN